MQNDHVILVQVTHENRGLARDVEPKPEPELEAPEPLEPTFSPQLEPEPIRFFF